MRQSCSKLINDKYIHYFFIIRKTEKKNIYIYTPSFIQIVRACSWAKSIKRSEEIFIYI